MKNPPFYGEKMTIYHLQVSAYFPEKIMWSKIKEVRKWGEKFYAVVQNTNTITIDIDDLNKVKIDTVYQYAAINFIDGKNTKKYIAELRKKVKKLFA